MAISGPHRDQLVTSGVSRAVNAEPAGSVRKCTGGVHVIHVPELAPGPWRSRELTAPRLDQRLPSSIDHHGGWCAAYIVISQHSHQGIVSAEAHLRSTGNLAHKRPSAVSQRDHLPRGSGRATEVSTGRLPQLDAVPCGIMQVREATVRIMLGVDIDGDLRVA